MSVDMNAIEQSIARDALAADTLRDKRLMLAGLGNIGSFLAALVAPLVGFVRLVDRDIVEAHSNQFYGQEDAGRSKVDVTFEHMKRLNPQLRIECRVMDLERLPWEDFADIDVVLSGLDSLRARQLVSEKTTPLAIPYIDGAVGDPLLSRTQVFLPGHACLECGWGDREYEQLSTEMPCHPGESVQAPPTRALSCAGAATASMMAAQCVRLFGEQRPSRSYEIYGDVAAGRFVTSGKHRNHHCRFRHEAVTKLIRLESPFRDATVADLISAAQQGSRNKPTQFEFPCGILDTDLFGANRFATIDQLHAIRFRRLVKLGLTSRDRVVVRSADPHATAHVCFG